jgi:AAA+ ATPase superfamily predicted ATPase
MIPFLNRSSELARLRRALTGRTPGFVCLYGRRRLGKSRLLREALLELPAVYYVGDERESALQRRALAREIARHLEGFDAVEYPEWDSLLTRFWESAPSSLCLVVDELPSLVQRAPTRRSADRSLGPRRSHHLISVAARSFSLRCPAAPRRTDGARAIFSGYAPPTPTPASTPS